MKLGNKCYCLLAGLAGGVALLLKAYCFDDYPLGQWDMCTWIAAIGLTALFIVCGALGCKKS